MHRCALKCISAGEIHQPQKRTACISQRVRGRIVKILPLTMLLTYVV